jgi:hypothetical protein
VTCAELLAAYNEWKGPKATGCDQTCCVTAHKVFMSGLCIKDIERACAMHSNLDGDPTDISPADVQMGCDLIKNFQEPPNNEIKPDSFAAWWDMFYNQVFDKACPNPC